MPPTARLDDEDENLLGRMAQKDAAAFAAFYDRYNRIAFGLVLRILKVREDAEDVLTEVFWQAWQQAGRYERSRGKPVAWLLTIARTRAIDNLRSGNRQRAAEVITPSEAPPVDSTDVFVLTDTRKTIREALESLPDHQRIPLEMAYFEGMSHTEIAAAMNQPLGTMKDRIRAGMITLRKRLKAYL